MVYAEDEFKVFNKKGFIAEKLVVSSVALKNQNDLSECVERWCLSNLKSPFDYLFTHQCKELSTNKKTI